METQIEFGDINGNLLHTTANETIISGVTCVLVGSALLRRGRWS